MGEMKITFAFELQGDSEEIGIEIQKFAGYLPAVHSMNPESRYEVIEGNELRKL